MVKAFSVQRLFIALLGCGALAVTCFGVAVALGDQPLSWAGVHTPGSAQETIFYGLRLPRVTLAAMVGAALAGSGMVLQALLRNPLADPFVLGVSGGAALGATVALALGMTVSVWGFSAPSLLALVGAVGATVLVLSIGRLASGDRPHTTLLAGVISNAFALAAIIFIKALVAPDQLGEILFWLAGTLGQETASTLLASGLVVVIALSVMVAFSAQLNVMTLGDDDARSLGIDVRRTRLVLFIVASVAVSAAVSLSGLIGFVGLLVPHLAKLLFGADQRIAVPASALLGASFLMLADLGARLLFSVFHTEPPVGVITALLGGPLFLLLMLRRASTSG